MRLSSSFLLLFAAVLVYAQPAWASGKVALVIGNSNYSAAGRLENPANDTRIISDALRRNAFDVIPVTDASLAQFRTALREFRSKAAGADIAMVYYAGHGIEANGSNWLIPVDAKLESDFDLSDEAVDLNRVLEALEGSQVRVVVLDACRNNPFGRSWTSKRRSVGRGLAPIEIDDVLVMYAAAPGQVAQDGDDGNSPFAKSLAARLVEPGLPLQLLGGAVRDDVLRSTGKAQRPFVSASMTGTPIYLRPIAEAKAANAQFVETATLAATSGSVDVAALIGECDRQAGVEFDPDRPIGAPFVSPENIVAASAISACQKAVDNSLGNARMMAQLGRSYDKAGDFVVARSWYERAAVAGQTTAITNLGNFYRHGEGGLSQNYTEARRLYQQAAAKGQPVAMFNLGHIYGGGEGVPIDYNKARKLYEQAAEKGFYPALTALGHLYSNAFGVQQDYKQARGFFEQAAAKGDSIAMINLGLLYEQGLGVRMDLDQARDWFRQAAARGNEDAGKWIAEHPE